MPIFYSINHPLLVGERTIFAVVPLGLQPILDASVPGTNNYLAAGVVHHNTGKTEGGGGYELTCHLTGLYPDWWIGRRFARPISAWMAGKTNETTRDILQKKLLGKVIGRGQSKYIDGTGVIPGGLLGQPTWKQGIPNLVDTIEVKHATGDWSTLGVKSYEQGRDSFEGTEQDVIWLDEEPPEEVYGECLIRTATTNGIIMLTFTPLEGLSAVVKSFLPQEQQLSA